MQCASRAGAGGGGVEQEVEVWSRRWRWPCPDVNREVSVRNERVWSRPRFYNRSTLNGCLEAVFTIVPRAGEMIVQRNEINVTQGILRA